MSFTLLTATLAVGLFVGVIVLLEAGRRIGNARIAREGEEPRTGLGAVEGAVFGLLGLLLAFTFSGAAERFQERRELILREANAIGTAYLRLDLLPPESRAPLQQRFRDYLDARIAVYSSLPDMEAAKAALAKSLSLQAELWTGAVTATSAAGSAASRILLPALNEVFDIATTRIVATQNHPPLAIYLMLVAMTLVSALLVGYGMAGAKTASALHRWAYAAVMAAALHLIVDLEYPRLGLIRVVAADKILVDVRASMK
jgi:hypothetical protein